MGKHLWLSAVLAAGVAVSNSASAVPIISGDGTETCIQGPALGSGGTCQPQLITVGYAQPNNPNGSGAVWISYADTGRPGTVTAPPGRVATFVETFVANVGDVLELEVWADNTAGVAIDGNIVLMPNFVEGGTCAVGPVGCLPGNQGVIRHVFTYAGQHTLSLEVYQTGSLEGPPGNPFGLLYAGNLQRTLPLLTVTIDIKPGSFPNSINLKSKGVVPVAILSGPGFNVVDVDVSTLSLAGASPETLAFEDVNQDGVADLVLHFRTQDLELASTSTQATLTGKLRGDLPITGTDSVRIVPANSKAKTD